MNEELIKKLNSLRNVGLSAEAKEKMRNNLFSYAGISGGKAKTGKGISSPFSGLYFLAVGRNPVFRYGIAAFLIFALSGSGVVFAAEGSAPGDILYPVKTQINERALRLVAVSPEKKAVLENRIIGRRIDEIEKLSKEGRLDKDSASVLLKEVEDRSSALEGQISRLREKGKEDEAEREIERHRGVLEDHREFLNYAITLTTDEFGQPVWEVRGKGESGHGRQRGKDEDAEKINKGNKGEGEKGGLSSQEAQSGEIRKEDDSRSGSSSIENSGGNLEIEVGRRGSGEDDAPKMDDSKVDDNGGREEDRKGRGRGGDEDK